MKKINCFIALVVLISLMQSCYKDKGNYEYESLSKITLDSSGTDYQSEYAIYRYDTLTINPVIYINGTRLSGENQVSDLYEFTWVIFQATVGGNISTRDTLSHALNFSEPITKTSGKWVVHLTIKEKATQVETYFRYTVDVAEALSDGWMVLYEKDGKTDVGVIVDDRTKKGVVTARLFLDLIKNSNGEALDGKPVGAVHSIGPLTSAEVLIASEHDFVAVDRTSFAKAFLFDELFWSSPAEKSLKSLVGNYLRKEIVINSNKLHSVNFASSGLYRTNKLGPAVNGTYGELENWIAGYFGSSYDGVVYDKTNKKFKYVATGGIVVSDFPTQTSSTAEFSPSNVGLDFKTSDWGLTNYEYSIMADNANSYLLISNFVAAPAAVALRKINMSTSPEITSVTTMASALAGQYLLYGAGSNLYTFKYNTGLPAELSWSAPAGETVTCVRLQKFYYPVMAAANYLPLPNQVVYIATWNETTKEGKVFSYKIDASNGAIDLSSERITEGYGKVKDMSYKWNL